MKIIGIIAEYNPFHNGHIYQINKTKEKFENSAIVALMSGSFVQRGEPALIDKWSRAQMALDNGVDLVLELPTMFSTQTAELFAKGAINIFNSLNTIDYISFGSESGDMNTLMELAKILVKKPTSYLELLDKELNNNNSFPIARSLALSNYLNNPEINNILNNSNNILAIEYLKELLVLNSNIKPLTIKRSGGLYGDSSLDHKFASATAIREHIHNPKDIKPYVPTKTFELINSNINNLNNLNNYEEILLYLLRTLSHRDMDNVFDGDSGLGNRILNNSERYNNLDEIISNSISKIHTRTRVQRVLIQILLDINKTDVLNSLNSSNEFIRILGSNKKGLSVLRNIKQNSNIEIINRFSDYKKSKNTKTKLLLELDKKATDVFYLPLKSNSMNMDFFTSPYIKKGLS